MNISNEEHQPVGHADHTASKVAAHETARKIVPEIDYSWKIWQE
jgi:hypothetical protein